MNNNSSCKLDSTNYYTSTESTNKAYKKFQKEIKIASLNIDASFIPENKYKGIFPDYYLSARMLGIKNKLNGFRKQQVSIITIQEARISDENNTKIDAVTPIVNLLKNNNYIAKTIHYNNLNNNVFQFITALDKDQFEFISNKRVFCSKDGKDYPNIQNLSDAEKKQHEEAIKSHYFEANHHGQLFPRSFFITKARNIATNKEIFVVNTHLGVFPASHKTQSIIYIIEYLTKLHNKHPNSIIFLAGDFNSFPDQQGIEQITMLHDANFKELSKKVVDVNGEKVIGNSSFVVFPYDYASFNADKLVIETKKQAEQLQQNESPESNGKNLDFARNQFIETFNKLSEASEKIWQQEHNEFNSNALYPFGGQLDHIFILANANIAAAEETAIIQLMDIQGNIIASDKNSIVKHIQNSLAKRIPAFPTDHQGLVATAQLLTEEENFK